MIRSLRRRHRFAALTLAVSLPPALFLALAARPSAPLVAGRLAVSLGEPTLSIAGGRIPLPAGPGTEQSIGVALGREASGARVVELDTRGAPALPDALVYWSASAPTRESLPLDSFFLGALPADGVRAYPLPSAAASSAGSLFVFSVAWQKLLLAQSLAPEVKP